MTWVWASSGSWRWTGKPGVLQSMGLQRVGHDWPTELNWVILGMVEEDGDEYPFWDNPPHQQQNVLTVAEFQTLKYLHFLVLPVPLKAVSSDYYVVTNSRCDMAAFGMARTIKLQAGSRSTPLPPILTAHDTQQPKHVNTQHLCWEGGLNAAYINVTWWRELADQGVSAAGESITNDYAFTSVIYTV